MNDNKLQLDTKNFAVTIMDDNISLTGKMVLAWSFRNH